MSCGCERSGFAPVVFPRVAVAGAPCVVPSEGDHFRVTLFGDVHHLVVAQSALRHGSTERDIAHAVRHCVVLVTMPDEADLWLALGPDPVGRVLEVLFRIDGDRVVTFHSMPVRQRFRYLLDGSYDGGRGRG